MAEEPKQNKERKSFTLKPINIAWLAKKSLDESTPENKVSDSELVDRLIDEARAADSKSPSTIKQKKSATPALEIVTTL